MLEEKEILFLFGKYLIKFYLVLMLLYTVGISILKEQVYFNYEYYLVMAILYLILFVFAHFYWRYLYRKTFR